VTKSRCQRDGTRKYRCASGAVLRSTVVYIPEEGRGTLLVFSSQVGLYADVFLSATTGTQKRRTGLRPRSSGRLNGGAAMIWANGQCPDHLPRPPRLCPHRPNGHGEPRFITLKTVPTNDEIANDPEGIQAVTPPDYAYRLRGCCRDRPPQPKKSACQLAVSFHATTDEVRNKLGAIQTSAGTSQS